MKRTYNIPSMIVVHLQAGQMIADSGVTSDNGIGFGGKVGEDDGIIPEVKYHSDIWDEDW